MKNKKKGARVTVSELTTSDVLSTPAVAIPDQSTLAAAVHRLGPDNRADVAAKTTETTGSATETVVEKDSETDEDGTTTETTTTTTTETNYSGETDDSEEEEEEETDGKEDADASAARVTPPVAARAAPIRITSGDVLVAVREVTGANTPTEQIAAIRGMSSKVASLTKEVRGLKRANAVDAAIRSGHLAPAERAFALTLTPRQLSAKLATSAPVVRTTPLSVAKDAKPTATVTPATPSAEAVAVARAMGMDPAALETHRAELVKSGVLH